MNHAQSFLINSPWMGVMIFTFAAVLTALCCYFVARTLLAPRIAADSELLAGRVITRLGALHALILALMFAQEMADYRDVFRIVTKEASAIADVYYGLQEYDEGHPKSTVVISERIVNYVASLLKVKEEHAAIAENPLTYRARIDHQRINRQLRELQPTNDVQEDVRARMLADWDVVSDFHQRIKASVEYEFPNFFWMVLITGFVATVIPFYVYSPKMTNLIMLSTFAAVNGIVMYAIYAIENPLSGPIAIDSNVLADLLRIMGNPER